MSIESDDEKKSKFAGAVEWADHFESSIKSESTRAKVVLSACYLEELLRQLIEVTLAPSLDSDDALLDGPQAPLGTLSSKIELAFRIGKISSKDRTSLHYVRKIRNRFAHGLSTCDFDDAQIRSWNAELHKLNDHATPETRARFPEGPIGDFDKSISWLVYWLKHTIETSPSECPTCGSEIAHRAKIKAAKPGEHP